ncbi:MAG: response regulator, partial [Polyangiaceae bacterium]
RDLASARADASGARLRYESGMTASQETAWSQDLTTGANDFSPVLVQRLGYLPEEFPRSRSGMRHLWHPDDLPLIEAARTRHVTEGTAGEVEARLRCKSGEYRWVRLVGKPVFEDGRAVRLVGHVRDVHERKVAELALLDSERMFRALFEETSIAVTVRDADTQKFIDCNPAALRLYGLESREELRDTTPDALAPPTQPDGRASVELLRAYVQRAARDGVARMEWVAQRRNGESFLADVHTTVIKLEDGRRIMQTSIEDVTERTRNVRELEQRARRDDLVSRVSRQFVQGGQDVALPFALEALGTFLGADRVRMRCFFDSGATLVTLQEWRAPGIPAYPHPREDAASPVFRYVADSLARNGYLAICDMNALHGDVRVLQSAARPTTTRALLILPVTNQGALIGWIVVEQLDKTRLWSDEDLATARLITEIIAIARARAEAEEKTQRRAAHDELLSEVSRRFLNEDPEAITDATVERLGERLDAESVGLFALDERDQRLRCTHRWSAAGVGGAFESLENYPVPAGAFVPIESAKGGAARSDAQELTDSWLETLQRDSGKRVLYAKVGYGGQVFGLLSARAQEGRAWTDDDAATLQMVAELIAVGRVRRAAEVALARATENAIAASLTKSAFLANMSHELRTPLNGVIGMVDLLATTPLDERQKRYAEVARASASLLLSIISDILDFSKIEAGKLELEAVPVSLSDIVEDVASMLALNAEEKGLELACQSDLALAAPLLGDPARLRQVLVNLVSNAIKFTRRGEVSVKASLLAESPERMQVRVEVRDTGVGIPSDAQAKLFRPFTQLDASTTREHGGTGLGLAISRELVERMDGTIGLESTPGRGSMFWFELSLRRPRGAPKVEVERDARLAGLRVLAVEDNPTNREVLCAQLSAAGMVCDSAADGFVALGMLVEAAATNPYALAIIDHHMPGMDGRELAKRVKTHPRLGGTRLVMIGSMATPLSVNDQRSAGIHGYCTKPILRKQLLHVLHAALEGAPEGRAHEASARRPASEAQARTAATARILLVEDSPVNAEVAGEILRSAGYAFDVAVDGLHAIDCVKSRSYDLVLMDCQLPELDGYEATRRIRSLEREGTLSPAGASIPIVALSASTTKEDLTRSVAAGMNDHVSKPVDARRLLTVIATHLKGGPTNAAQSGPPRPPSIPVADMSRALERLAGDRSLLRRIASLFADGAPTTRAKLRAAVEARAAGDIGFALHKLKGQASTFGGEALIAAAESLEAAASRGNWTAVGASLLTVEKELDRLLGALAVGADTRRA